ncbi:MAG: hypothetical protein HY718_12155 [Planctomycetes bacterium]|nr:hypothetical protein [Planctomycetota bacterium]
MASHAVCRPPWDLLVMAWAAAGAYPVPAAPQTPPPPPITTAGATAPTESAAPSLLAAPSGIDLDVTLIERLPRYAYDAAKNNPAAGDVVTFNGHIRCWGTGSVASATYQWSLDGLSVASGTLTNLNPGDERVVSWSWVWVTGAHRVRLTVDPGGQVAESSEANNALEDRTDAVIVGFWVEQSVYNYFALYQKDLGVGSDSWEDWAQRQMGYWNQFSAQAIYSTTPLGVLDRVRIDKLVIVPDGALPLHGGLPTNNPDLWDKTVDMMWGFPASLLGGGMYANHTSATMDNPFYYEGSLLHELGHARYLIDTYGFDVHNTSSYHQVQILEDGVPVGGSSYMPFLAFGEVLYYNKNGKMMSGGYNQGWSEYDAGALNRIAGQRAVCGNYNAPCNIGVFLNDLPARNHFRFVDDDGTPRRGANVRVYRPAAGPGWYGKTIDDRFDLEFTSDADGRVLMPRNPFADGPIQHTYGIANGIMVLRVQHAGRIWYRFQEVTDFNIQYWRGNTQDAYYTLVLPGPNVIPGDFDLNGKVNVYDFNHFVDCRSGADVAIVDPGCTDADLDFDADADQSDFGIFQRCLSGDQPADPACQ